MEHIAWNRAKYLTIPYLDIYRKLYVMKQVHKTLSWAATIVQSVKGKLLWYMFKN